MPHWETLDFFVYRADAESFANRLRSGHGKGYKIRITKTKHGHYNWQVQFYDRQSRLNSKGHYIGSSKKGF